MVSDPSFHEFKFQDLRFMEALSRESLLEFLVKMMSAWKFSSPV